MLILRKRGRCKPRPGADPRYSRPGEKNAAWKGGRTLASQGYVLIKCPDHPNADYRGYIYEHRLVASRMLGRPLSAKENVHHKNGIKTDNRLCNLEICASLADHLVRHRGADSVLRLPGEPNPEIVCVCGCGQTLLKYDSHGRPRKRIYGHGKGTRRWRWDGRPVKGLIRLVKRVK